MGQKRDDVATRHSWDNLQPMPDRFVVIPLDLAFDRQQAARLRQGYIPAIMEENWFAYFEDGILYQHRSWTGICIDAIHFVADGDGLRATSARVNRDPRQYSETDDNADARRIAEMLLNLANCPPGAHSNAVDPFVEAMSVALQPNYLGSPEVIHRVVMDYVDVLVANWRAGFDAETMMVPDEEVQAVYRLAEILSGADPEFVKMPWHCEAGLGKNVIEALEMDPREFERAELRHTMTYAVLFFGCAIRDCLDEPFNRADGVSAQLKELIEFFVAVQLGTNGIHFPGNTISDFVDFNPPAVSNPRAAGTNRA